MKIILNKVVKMGKAVNIKIYINRIQKECADNITQLGEIVVQFILSNSHTSHKPQMLENLHKTSWTAKSTYKINNNTIIAEVKTNYLK